MRNKVDWVGGERQYVGRGVNGVKSVFTKKVGGQCSVFS